MRDSLVLFLNGRRHEIADAWAAATLAEWLRDRQRLTATKVVCSEGDCGACSVLVGRLDLPSGRLAYRTIDACIALMFQLDLTHIVTVEGLAPKGRLSPVQDAMIACHGSQCGFCTPGFVATLHGLVEARALGEEGRVAGVEPSEPPANRLGAPLRSDPSHPLRNGSAADCDGFDVDELRYGLSGNLCRCTGYQQILEAGESINLAATPRVGQLYDERPIIAEFQRHAEQPVSLAFTEGGASRRFCLPTTLKAAADLRAKRPTARLIAGATDLGVQRNHGRIELTDVICLNKIAELAAIHQEGDVLVIGAGATWKAVEDFVADTLPEFAEILARFGSPQIRNMGTVGGNVANASPIADSLPLFYALEATVHLTSTAGTRTVPIEQFYLGYKKLDQRPDELIASVRMRVPATGADERLHLAKVSKRRDMDISTVASAAWLRIENDRIAEARFALGGVGPTVVRCRKAEAAVLGKPLCEETLRAAGVVARGEVTPISDVRAGADYRAALVENLLAKAGWELSLAEAEA